MLSSAPGPLWSLDLFVSMSRLWSPVLALGMLLVFAPGTASDSFYTNEELAGFHTIDIGLNEPKTVPLLPTLDQKNNFLVFGNKYTESGQITIDWEIQQLSFGLTTFGIFKGISPLAGQIHYYNGSSFAGPLHAEVLRQVKCQSKDYEFNPHFIMTAIWDDISYKSVDPLSKNTFQVSIVAEHEKATYTVLSFRKADVTSKGGKKLFIVYAYENARLATYPAYNYTAKTQVLRMTQKPAEIMSAGNVYVHMLVSNSKEAYLTNPVVDTYVPEGVEVNAECKTKTGEKAPILSISCPPDGDPVVKLDSDSVNMPITIAAGDEPLICSCTADLTMCGFDPTLASMTVRSCVPPGDPEVRLSSQGSEPLSNGSIIYAGKDEEVQIKCDINPDHKPLITKMEISCDPNGEISGSESSLTLNVTVDTNKSSYECHCDVYYTCAWKEEEKISGPIFTIKLASGPDSVYIIKPDYDPPVCQDTTLAVNCGFDEAPIPGGTMVLRGVAEEDIQPISSANWLFFFYFVPTKYGQINATCVGQNSINPDFMATKSIPIFATKQPTGPLEINGGAGFPSDGSYQTYEGEVLELTCSNVGEGIPDVYNFSLVCGIGNEIKNEGKQVSANFTVTKSMHQVECECQSIQLNADDCYNKTTKVSLNVAYGPTELILTGPPGLEYDLCPSNPDLSVQAEVSLSDVNPPPKVTLKGLSASDLELDSPTVTEKCDTCYTFSSRPTAGGNLTLEFVATNKVYEVFTTQKSLEIYVSEPPSEAPVISVNGETLGDGANKTLDIDTTASISCSVAGGEPAVSEVHLSCGGEEESVTAKGTLASLDHSVTTASHRLVCTCSATHRTGCYDKQSRFFIDVAYPANIQTHTVDSSTTAWTDVEFVCHSEGIPLPSVVITGLYSGVEVEGALTSPNFYSRSLQASRTLACNQSDVYTCTASNSAGAKAQQSVTIAVQCGPERVGVEGQSRDQDLIAPLAKNGIFSLKAYITSHPSPVAIVLQKSQEGQRSAYFEYDEDLYQTDYKELNANHGEVRLQAYDGKADNGTSYRLLVTNGVGQGLNIDFHTSTALGVQEDSKSAWGSQKLTALIATSVVAFLILIICLLLVVLFVRWLWTSRAQMKAEAAKRAAKRRRGAGEGPEGPEDTMHGRSAGMYWAH